jgi:putative transposase
MTRITTKPSSDQQDAETAVYLFDDWFDPIEAGLRDRVRDFIETMIRAEFDAALGHPRSARRSDAGIGGDGAGASVVGHRHGSRTRTLTETL